MPLYVTPAALILLFTSAIIALASVLAWRRRAIPAGRELFWLFSAVLIWALSAALSEASASLPLSIFWSRVEYLGSAAAGPLTLLFCITFARRTGWRTSRKLWALWVLPVLTVLLVLTNDWHHLIWTSVTQNPVPGPDRYLYRHGPAFWAYVAYSYIYTVAGAILILQEYLQSSPLYKRQSGAVLVSMLFPWIGGLLYAFDLAPIPGLDVTPVGFAFTAIIIAWAMFSTRLLDLIPIAHTILLQSMQDAIIVMDARDRIVETNPAMAHLLGHRALPIGETAADTFHEWPSLAALLTQRPPLPSEIQLPGEAGRYFDFRLMPIRSGRGGDEGHLAVLRDITRRRHAELALEAKSREMEQQAITDDLTGLYNRRYINRLLDDEFGRAQRYGLTFSTALLDIDDFKQINDRFGHHVGDEVLQFVAQTLLAELRATDVASRLGGDEFMIILPHTDINGAFQVMDRVRNTIYRLSLTPEQTHISCSVGLTSRVADDSQETLLQRADRLLYAAKDQGRNRVLSST